MFHKFEKNILTITAILVFILLPRTFLDKGYKKWLIAFFINSYSNTFIAPLLAYKGYLNYPVRIFPRIYKSSIIYDYFVCSLITVWFCRATARDSWKKALMKVWLFSTPQAILEYWFEINTELIKYRKGWTAIHSLITITIAKFSIRSILAGFDKLDKGRKKPSKKENYDPVYEEHFI